MQKQTLLAGVFAVALIAPGLADATPTYSAMYVFGDSLSDRGNLAEAFGNKFVDPPSYHYSFTNGPVAVSVLASRLGLTADPSLWVSSFQDKANIFPAGYVPGTNYAVGGATAQEKFSGINLPDQVNAYLGYVNNVADPNALYTVFIGGNDVRDAALSNSGGAAAITNAVSSEIAQIQGLINVGAKNLFVVNVTDVGAIPEFALEKPSLAPQATAYTEQYDLQLAIALKTLTTSANTNILGFDLLNYNRVLLANASQFGISNTTDPCWVITDIGTLSSTPTTACGLSGSNIGEFAFWNNVHPTQQVHALIGEGFLQALDGNPSPSPIPEPTSVAVVMAGILWMLGVRRRHGSTHNCPGMRHNRDLGATTMSPLPSP